MKVVYYIYFTVYFTHNNLIFIIILKILIYMYDNIPLHIKHSMIIFHLNDFFISILLSNCIKTSLQYSNLHILLYKNTFTKNIKKIIYIKIPLKNI